MTFLIEHYHDTNGTCIWSDTPKPHDEFQYALAETKPNFPVPAIPLACAILPDLVQIAEVFWLDDWLETQGTLPEFELVAEFEKK